MKLFPRFKYFTIECEKATHKLTELNRSLDRAEMTTILWTGVSSTRHVHDVCVMSRPIDPVLSHTSPNIPNLSFQGPYSRTSYDIS